MRQKFSGEFHEQMNIRVPPNQNAAHAQQTPVDDVGIWLVEDNALYRKSICELLSQTGWMSCEVAYSTCEEALQGLEEKAPPDVILLDIGLPGMSGVDAVPRIKSISPSTHVIMLTVHDEDENVFRAISGGASGYLLKMSSPESVVGAIRDVLQGGAPINPQIARKVLDSFARASAQATDYGLTAREREILELVVEGLPKQKIAEKIFLSYHTVDSHLRNIYQKLHVNSRSRAITKALKEKLV